MYINCHDNCTNRDTETFEDESDTADIIDEEPATYRIIENEGLEVADDLEDPSESETCFDEKDA